MKGFPSGSFAPYSVLASATAFELLLDVQSNDLEEIDDFRSLGSVLSMFTELFLV